MSLTIGTQVGIYKIAALLGKGGMGEVYRARDTRLDREVALKTLPQEFAKDSDRLSRFEREAKLLASLNHPNIGTIFGFEESQGTRFLVLELVEGETLADRLQRGALSLEESIQLAIQIAEALEAAHDKGVIHRDLKPANIKITADGKVKVLDFGLAKAFTPDDSNLNVSNSPTLTMAATQQGIILGTAAYMSPEQARGKNLDRRTDVWALAAVMYEMLTGKQAFPGEDVGDILATVVKTDPDWTLLPHKTSENIRTLLRRCLRKDRRQRLGDAGAVRIELEEALAAPATTNASINAEPHRNSVSLVAVVLVGIIAITVAFMIGKRLNTAPMSQERVAVARLNLSLPIGVEFSEDAAPIVISPDGTQVAYIGVRGAIKQLYIRRMDEFESQPLKNTLGAAGPFFSTDGKWLGFFADGKLKRVSITRGVVEVLTDADPQGGSWGSDGNIVYLSKGEFFKISDSGGTPQRLPTSNSDRTANRFHRPDLLPGGAALLFVSSTSSTSTVDERSIEVLNLKTGERKTLLQGGYNPHYVSTGHLIFLRSQMLMAVPFDLDRLEVKGTPVPLIEGLRQSYAGAVFSCSNFGTCVYLGGSAVAQRTTVAVIDRAGISQTLPLAPQNYTHPRFSPKGDKIAFWIEQSRCDIVVYDIGRNVLSRLTSEGDNHFPIWNPNGQEITFLSGRPGIQGYNLMSKPIDGSRREERLTDTLQNLQPISPLSWSPDASVLAFTKEGDIWLQPMSGKNEARPYIQSMFNETMPAFSPDGHWLAYVSDESGEQEIYVQPYPGPGAKYRISTGGGTEPAWAQSGRELFFRNRDQIMVVQLTTQPKFTVSQQRVVFVSPFSSRATRTNYDVSPDGERFVMVNDGEHSTSSSQINVVLNWLEELKQRVPVK